MAIGGVVLALAGNACSLLDPSSIAAVCLSPPDVMYASAHVSDAPVDAITFEAGSVTTYECDTGYEKVGDDTTCGREGTWSASPTCEPIESFCPTVPPVMDSVFALVNGGVAGAWTTSLHSTVTYTCDSGFAKVGADATCLDTGAWSIPPVCTYVDCGSPAVPVEGTVLTPSGTEYAAIATYSCRLGYVRSGPRTRACQEDGTWSGAPPRCVVNAFVGDFDHDGREDDHATWNPATHTWRARTTQDTDIFSSLVLGSDGDVPLVGDFDSDGFLDDVAVYSPSLSTFQIRRTDGSNPVPTNLYADGLVHFGFGADSDVPIVGDWDSDGLFDDLAVCVRSGFDWFAIRIRDHATLFQPTGVIRAGLTGFTTFIGDVDQDGRVDDLVDTSAGIPAGTLRLWYGAAPVSNLPPYAYFNGVGFGFDGDQVMMDDFDGDGLRDDMIAYHRLGATLPGTWSARRVDLGSQPSSVVFTAIPIVQPTFGESENTAIVGDFDGDGFRDDMGIYDWQADLWSATRRDGTAIMTNVR